MQVPEQDVSEPPLPDLLAYADATVYTLRALQEISDTDAFMDLTLSGGAEDQSSVLDEVCEGLKSLVKDIGGVIVRAVCGVFRSLSAEYEMEGRLWSPQVCLRSCVRLCM